MIVQKNYYFDTRVRRYTESLLSLGYQVDVICPPEDYETIFEEKKGLRVHTIPIHHYHRGQIGYIFEYCLSIVFYIFWLLSLHTKNHYQVIHVHNMPDFLAFTALIPKILGAALFLDIHDPMPEVYRSKYGERANKLVFWFIALQERLSCKLADVVLTANSIFKENLIKRGTPAEKITIINNFPNLEKFNRAAYIQVRRAKRETFSLIYPGTIAPRYGLDVAIRAIPLLITRIPNLSLVIIGHETQYKKQLMQLVEQLDVSSFVSFLPLIPNEEVPLKIAQADIGIYTALPDAHMNIATPTKVLEFATMGIPIISSRLRILEDMFDDSSIMFFKPGVVNQFAQCVIKLYENPKLRQELVHNADQLFVFKHSWEQEFQAYLDLLNHLLPGKIEKIGLPKVNKSQD